MMKAKLVLGIFCASLFAVAIADAAPAMTELQRQAYETGWDGADAFCSGLRPRTRPRHRETLTQEFKRYCRRGFDDNIDHNRACKSRIRNASAYREMWSARSDTCL